jgi:nucleotide-binding universal stress UspA family protein
LLEKAEKRIINEGISRVECHIAESWEGGKDMAESLIRFADSRHAELIVIGTHGRTGLAHCCWAALPKTSCARRIAPCWWCGAD